MNDYKKYRWFFTRSGKLVYGGKSAEQNEEIIQELMKTRENKIVMHTKSAGSPFAIIDAPLEKVNERDLEECAIWTGCYSRAWREQKKDTEVDIFTKNDLYKEKEMKNGTFGVSGKIERKIVKLKLALIFQKNVLRAVPIPTLKKNTKIYSIIAPGNEEKEKFSKKLAERIKIKKEEVLNALPPGKFKELKKK